MLRAIWVDDEDERIISEAMIAYEKFSNGEGAPLELWSPTLELELLRIRALTNRIKRAKEEHEKSL